MFYKIIYCIWATVFLCGGIAAGGPINKRDNPAVSQELFDRFKRYAAFSAAAYADDCQMPPSGVTITNRIDDRVTDTYGYIARDDSAKEIVVAFRGTSSLRDFATDFASKQVDYTSVGVKDCTGCLAHLGFLTAWNAVAQTVIDLVKTGLTANPGYNVTVTGHSLGGAIASFAVMSMIGSDIDAIVYTFGEPRTGNAPYADFFDQRAPQGKSFRITHANDGVPQTVSTSDGYRHHSTEYWQRDEPIAAGTFQCSGQEPQDCNNSVRGTGIGPNGIGINAAHLEYVGVSTGNPLERGRLSCDGSQF